MENKNNRPEYRPVFGLLTETSRCYFTGWACFRTTPNSTLCKIPYWTYEYTELCFDKPSEFIWVKFRSYTH